MKHSQIAAPWKEGLHLRAATLLVKNAMRFQSTILLKVNDRLADARSILAVLLLCASCGAVVELEINGSDEDDALAALSEVFRADDLPPASNLAVEGKKKS